MHDLSERVSSALEPIMIFIIFCGFMVYGIRQLSGENTYKNPSKRAGIRKRTSKRYSFNDGNDYNSDSLSSEIYERASKKSDIPSGACPYINRDNKGYLYCNISGGEREIDSYTFSSKCKWSDTYRKCNIYTNLNGHEYIMEDLRRDGENDYQSSSSRYECPYIFQDRGGYRYCTAGGGKEPVDSWQYSHSCNHQGNGNSGYTGCHIYLVNK
jgi:hypothetical protein